MINCEIKLDKDKVSNKVYFDKKIKQFTNMVKKCGVLDELRLRKTFMKPSTRKKLSKQISAQKWKYYL
jgi:ribosomal protein S21